MHLFIKFLNNISVLLGSRYRYDTTLPLLHNLLEDRYRYDTVTVVPFLTWSERLDGVYDTDVVADHSQRLPHSREFKSAKVIDQFSEKLPTNKARTMGEWYVEWLRWDL
jgi:hypothetical protein